MKREKERSAIYWIDHIMDWFQNQVLESTAISLHISMEFGEVREYKFPKDVSATGTS
jgi:hypothetical protein